LKKYVFFLFFCLAAGSLWANPFTGTKETPAPVRTEEPPEFIASRQAQLHTQLGDYIYEWAQTHSVHAFWMIIALAFFYGFMHALGPGHRKTLVFSFYLSRSAPVWEPAVTGLILASLHGVTSIALLFVFRNVSGALSVHTNSATIYLEGFSFILLLALSAASILHLLAHAFPQRFSFFRFGCRRRPQESAYYGGVRRGAYNRALNAQARYPAAKIQWGAFLLSGIYPCPAALLVLVLVSTLDAAGIGVAAVVSISAGMAVPIIALAYLAWAGRQRLFKRMQKTQKYAETAALLLGLAAYSAIFVFSLIAVAPFLKNLVR